MGLQLLPQLRHLLIVVVNERLKSIWRSGHSHECQDIALIPMVWLEESNNDWEEESEEKKRREVDWEQERILFITLHTSIGVYNPLLL